MKNLKWSILILCSITAVLWSCDDDIDNLGDTIVGVDPNETIRSREVDVKAFSTPVNPVQTNNFGSYKLGTYEDPVYGRSTYSIVSQAVPSFLNPDFTGTDDNQTPPVLKSAYLEIPYFSRATGVDGEETSYELDSVYGSGLVNLKVFRNKFFLNNFDSEDLSENAIYYSDQKNQIEDVTISSNPEILFEKVGVPIDPSEVIITEDQDTVARKTPRLRLDLLSSDGISNSEAYWSDILFNQPVAYRSATNFKNFFRGIYIVAEIPSGSGPTLVYLNMEEASIIFSIDVTLTDPEEPIASEFRFDLHQNNVGSAISVNYIDSQITPNIQTEIEQSFQPQNGSENLYLKGGPGSLGLLDLFGEDLDDNGIADTLEEIISNRTLINDAILTFYVDQDVVSGGRTEPERIIIYNFDTGLLLADYNIVNELSGIDNNLAHLGRLERIDDNDETSAGIKYQIRITNHLNAVISEALNDDIPIDEKLGNARLALAISQNTGALGTSLVKDQITPIEIERVLQSSAISHEGTVLHGSQSSEIDKRPKLTIYYSTPN
ncbi:hypothetical protein BST97_11970 [Nonlabens spongiae]|uniref:DUF4270 domain-containing protein n=1 Tax=Nonlabens spongiae TaxID=331648 RepID=A0A1W6MMC9_9FLAO|nr:DUF4270 domain-containing protein [Nonlabens spongiae]ARN78649.1 hypothetical protein BST97_11970 [Nonlabens spongiae]